MFRKSFLAAAIIMAGMLLLGCGNSSTIKTITAKVEGAGDKADSVHLKTPVSPTSLAGAEFKDDRFSIQLPETVPSEFLNTVVESGLGSDDLIYSDANAKCCMGFLVATKNGSDAGIFQCGYGDNTKDNPEIGSGMVLIYYVDRDVEITGTMVNNNLRDGSLRYSCNFKKGWNYAAIIAQENGSEITTTLPTGSKWELLTD